ncbi:MAG: DNA polymerase I [Tissierellia bacterium]|nr:DNA polymerase I [Tissierellia bacterium]
MKEKFVLIDGSSLIFRAFYAVRNLMTKEGIFTNGVYGFLSMYYKIVEDYNPDYICVAFDRPGPTFRHEDYEAYKGTRDKVPTEINSQFGILKDILESLNVKYLDLQNYEADDICGTLAMAASKEGKEVYLVTGDRDYLQLVGDDRTVILTKKGITNVEVYTPEKIKEDYGITPRELIEVKGLMGDSSDNIPGVPGVGEKTALKYVKKYGTIENLYENIDDIKGKAKEKLIENKDIAFMSRSLGEIYLEAPVDTNLENYKVEEPDYDTLREKYERLEFKLFLEKLPNSQVEVEEDFKFEFIDEKFRMQEIAKSIVESKKIVFHFFYDGDKYIGKKPLFIGFMGAKSKRVYIVNLEKNFDDFIYVFKDIFEDKDIEKLSYDIKSDIYYLYEKGVEISLPYEDMTIAEYIIDPSKSKYDIHKSAKEYLGRDVLDLEDLVGKGKKMKSLKDLDENELGEYIGMYISLTDDLRNTLIQIIEDRDMLDLYFKVELPLIEVLASMEFEGFKVDKEYLGQLGEKFQAELDELEKGIYDFAGVKFNINSPKQLGEVLFEKLNLPVIKKTKTGYSTSVEVLDKLKGSHEIIDYILRYRSLKKLTTTYIDGLIKLIGEDGKIHSTFNQNITATGRISSTDPNLQNIPIRTEEGRLIRRAFVAEENHYLLDGDYSQIELRVLAHLADDEVMIEAFKNDADIHTKTASEVFHVEMDEVTPLQRSNAKAVNFGIVYGISDYGLSKDLEISRAEAREYIDKYKATYPGIKKYMDDIVEDGKENGYVETIMHRRRYIPELSSKNFNIRGFGERVALNTPIQGSAADIIKIAMVRVFEKLRKGNYKSKLLLQVHDELIIEAPEEEKDEVVKLLKDTMEDAVKLNLPLKVDINIGENWYDAK